ncbi:MAG: carbonic anhydrase [Kordiimonas sp.]|nr:carbonic anhydrase [Kordiimonas sp.]
MGITRQKKKEISVSFDDLLKGYQSFRSGDFEAHKALFQKLVTEGQSPDVMMVSCCDSRVDPNMITQADPGSMFVVRNVANLVPPYKADGESHGTSAALEFAVCHLEVKHIIVMGHAHCGGIKALMSGDINKDTGGDFILPWMKAISEARKRVDRKFGQDSEERRVRELELEGVRVSLDNLMTFDWVRDRVNTGDLSIHGWFFDIEAGEVLALDQKTDQFASLSTEVN